LLRPLGFLSEEIIAERFVVSSRSRHEPLARFVTIYYSQRGRHAFFCCNQSKGTTSDALDHALDKCNHPRRSVGGPARSQGAQQTASLMKVDPATLATGYRTSKVVGSTVVNEVNETVGTIDDLIITPTEKVPFAVLVG
jgi:hypothetical protein